MLPTEYKEIIGEVRFALSTKLKNQYPDMDGQRGFMQTTEPYLITTMFRIDPKGLNADYYIGPGDGGGPILVEVGDSDDTSWDELIAADGQPVRVLFIGPDRFPNLHRARNTQFEQDMLKVLVAGLKPTLAQA